MEKPLPRIVCSKPPTAISGVGPTHISALDGLRAIAILLVIPHNVDVLPAPGPLEYPVALFMHAGWIGVELFFVLSGYLITNALLDSRRADNYFSVFFARRILRIFPLYFTVLASAFLLAPLFHIVPEALRTTSRNQVWLWTFLSNWTLPFGHDVAGFGHFWSLAVEEQFYLLWPFVVRRCTITRLLVICATLASFALAFRILAVAEDWPKFVPYMFTISRMDALAFGAAAAASLRIPGSVELLRYWSVPLSSAGWVLFLVTVFVTRAYSMFDPVCETLGQTILAAVFTLAVIMVSVPKVGRPSAMYRGLSVPPLRVIGRYSFAMYVFHLPLHVFVGVPLLRRYVPAVPAWAAVVYTVVITITTFLLAALSYWLFESHFLRLKRYFVPTIRSGNLANGVDRRFAG